VFVLASVWGIASKYFIRDRQGHFFNPSNFAVVSALVLCRGLATVAPGSQWGGKAWIPIVILLLGTVMMYRVRRLDLVGAWLVGYVAMGALRVALGQGGAVFALGPMPPVSSRCSRSRCSPTRRPRPTREPGGSSGAPGSR
jgi:hypothetical protein